MRIGEVAQRAGVNVQTLRYYERRGLLPDPGRRASGYREYDTETVPLVRFIKHAQELGFTLREIGELIELRENRARSHREVRALAAAKLREVQRRIRRLTAIERVLEDLIDVCQRSGISRNCPIIEAMEVASTQDGAPSCERALRGGSHVAC